MIYIVTFTIEKAEFDMYTFHALIDACSVCAVLDGEHFKVKDAEPGINISPMHPNCRCSTGPYMDTEEFDEWLDGIDEHGLTFEEWKKEYKNGIINIEIDTFVPCLRDRKTGAILDTEARQITKKSELKQINKKNGWYIDWAKQIDLGFSVVGLYLKGDSELQGICSFVDDPDNHAISMNWVVSNPKNRCADKKYEGVGGHLFAIFGEQSVKKGYGGYVYGAAASPELLRYYQEKLGAKSYPGYRDYSLYIDERSMKKILDEYNFDWRG